MKAIDFRGFSQKELSEKIISLKENLFRLRCNKTLGQLEDTSVISSTKKDIARAFTIQNEQKKEA